MSVPTSDQRPTLETPRLILRPFVLDDAFEVQRLCSDFAIADTTAVIPHPYPDGLAEQWIATHADAFARREHVVLAVTVKDNGELIGSIGLVINQPNNRAELGYWISKSHWNRGYATEAGKRLVQYGFNELKLGRIDSHCFARNPASGRVLEKIGLQREGLLRSHFVKWDRREDLIMYGILPNEFEHNATAINS